MLRMEMAAVHGGGRSGGCLPAVEARGRALVALRARPQRRRRALALARRVKLAAVRARSRRGACRRKLDERIPAPPRCNGVQHDALHCPDVLQHRASHADSRSRARTASGTEPSPDRTSHRQSRPQMGHRHASCDGARHFATVQQHNIWRRKRVHRRHLGMPHNARATCCMRAHVASSSDWASLVPALIRP